MMTCRPDITAEVLARTRDTLEPNAVYEIDDGTLVAVAFAQTRTPANTLSCGIAAWQINEAGEAIRVADEDGLVLVELSHNAPAHQLGQLGVQGIADALRDLVLGEPAADPPAIPWSDDLRAQVSIRNAITIARAAGTTIDWSTP